MNIDLNNSVNQDTSSSSSRASDNSFLEKVKEKISYDLSTKLSTFNNMSAALNSFSKKTNLVKKQAHRYISKDCVPREENCILIYKFIYEEDDTKKVYDQLPELIKSFITKYSANRNKQSKFTCSNINIKSNMLESPVYMDIYWLTVDGHKISREYVKEQYGKSGLQVIDQMKQQGVINEIVSGIYSNGKSRANLNDPELNQKSAIHLIKNKYRPSMANIEDSNILASLGLKLSKEGKRLAIKAGWDYLQKLVEIEAKHRGDNLIFNVTAIDDLTEQTLSEEEPDSPNCNEVLQ